MKKTSLRLRPWVSLTLFLSAYSPLMLILIVNNIDFSQRLFLKSPAWVMALLVIAVASTVLTLLAAKNASSGLPVKVTKAEDRSGEMFSYSIPYVPSFMGIDFCDWQACTSMAIFMAVLFFMMYRTQMVFVNPVLAMAGYVLVACTFERDGKERQALVITRHPIDANDSLRLERLSHYLYINPHQANKSMG